MLIENEVYRGSRFFCGDRFRGKKNGLVICSRLGFLTVIAAQLLRMTYLHRNCPHLDASVVLTKVQMDVLIASSPPKLKKDIEFTVDWAIRAIARLGGYLEHRKNSAISIQVLWRGWLELETLCQGLAFHGKSSSLEKRGFFHKQIINSSELMRIAKN